MNENDAMEKKREGERKKRKRVQIKRNTWKHLALDCYDVLPLFSFVPTSPRLIPFHFSNIGFKDGGEKVAELSRKEKKLL